jgi:hypothetical protein
VAEDPVGVPGVGAGALGRAAQGVALERERLELGQPPEVEDGVEVREVVVAEREALQRGEAVQAVADGGRDLVVVQREVAQADQGLQALDHLDLVEGEV